MIEIATNNRKTRKNEINEIQEQETHTHTHERVHHHAVDISMEVLNVVNNWPVACNMLDQHCWCR